MAAVSHQCGLPPQLPSSPRISAIKFSLVLLFSTFCSKTSSGGVTDIVEYELRSNDLWEKTVAKGYKLGAHRVEDSKRNTEI